MLIGWFKKAQIVHIFRGHLLGVLGVNREDSHYCVVTMSIAVITDSMSDLTRVQAAALGVTILPMQIEFDGCVWQDQFDLTSEKVFAQVANGQTLPVSRPPSVTYYRDILEYLLATHEHVLAIHHSGDMSEMCHLAKLAASAFEKRVTVHDSRQCSAGLALQIERAVQLLAEGIGVTEIRKVLQAVEERSMMRMSLNNFVFLQKNGVVSGGTAAMGNFMGSRPILAITQGNIEEKGRVLGRSQAVNSLRKQISEYVYEETKSRIAFFHNGNHEAIDALQEEAAGLGVTEVMVLDIGIPLSMYGGPHMYGFIIEPMQVWRKFKEY